MLGPFAIAQCAEPCIHGQTHLLSCQVNLQLFAFGRVEEFTSGLKGSKLSVMVLCLDLVGDREEGRQL